MNRYKYFILEAKINSAEGFGHPSTNSNTDRAPRKNTKKPTKEELGRWRARSDEFRKNYLEKHPNSKFKDVPVRGNIITRSKKVSSKPWAKEMAVRGSQTLKDLGLRGKNISYVAAKTAASSIHRFINSKNREAFSSKAAKVFNNYRSKLKPEDREELDREAEEINKSPHAPSRTLLRKAGKGLIFGLVGLAAGAAMYSGVIPADIAVYLGVKVLDTSFEAARHSLREPLSTFIVANSISKFFDSKDSDEYAESVVEKLNDKGIKPDSQNTEEDSMINNKVTDTENINETDEEKLKRIVMNKLGPSFDPSKYYLDENENLKLKSRKT